MLTKTIFVVAAVLALLALSFPRGGGFQTVAVAFACLAAILAAIEAGRVGRYLWAAGLILLAALLNPVVPIDLARGPALALLGISLAIITSWMLVLRRTIPSQSIAQVLYPPAAK